MEIDGNLKEILSQKSLHMETRGEIKNLPQGAYSKMESPLNFYLALDNLKHFLK